MRYTIGALLLGTLLVPSAAEAGSRTGTIPVTATISPGTTTKSWIIRGEEPVAVSDSELKTVPHSIMRASVSFPTGGALTVTPHASWDPVSRILTLNF